MSWERNGPSFQLMFRLAKFTCTKVKARTCVNQIVKMSSTSRRVCFASAAMLSPVLYTKPKQCTKLQILAVSSDILEVKRSWYSAIRRWMHVLRLLFTFAPLVAMSPMLIVPYVKQTWWHYARFAVRHSSVACIKFIQWASTRTDSFPASFCEQFSCFHVAAPAHDWKATEKVLQESFGDKDWQSIVEIKNKKPVGSGCVAQVYKGTMVDSGEEVAIKIIHPKIRQKIEMDIELLTWGADFLEWLIPDLKYISLRYSMDTFAERMLEQLDMKQEGENLKLLSDNFKSKKQSICFPTPMMSSECMLIESFEDGIPMDSMLKRTKEYNGKRTARIAIKSFLEMIFLHNFAHGDLHPGNMLVRDAASSTPTLVMLDAGIVTRLSNRDLQNFIDLFYLIAVGDGYNAGKLLLERTANGAVIPEFCVGLDEIVKEATGKSLNLREVHVNDILTRTMKLCQYHKVTMEARYASLLIAIGVLEGVSRTLDPSIDLLRIALPIIARSKMQRLG